MHVVSTAGHVDHGKSALIERLTGIDPDRLAEEKARGLTIDLGFAWLETAGGREIGIVDVPGHERFVHNMLAGVGSVDATIFVVAANEGWMPQSEEHLAILEMLGARGGVVALSKADLVDAAALRDVRAQVLGRLAGTALDGCEAVAVSSTTGEGIDALLAALDRALDRAGDPPDRARPRIFVDRSFTVKGAGTVVTGTLCGGSLRVGDHVVVLPGGHRTRIRGIQTHRRAIDEARPVSRVALNLAGLERVEVRRGDAVVLAGQWEPSAELDVVLRTVRSLDHDIRNRGAFKVYVGSAELDARLRLHGGDAVAPGAEAFARLVLSGSVVAAPLDRFVLRDAGRRATVGGGVVLDAHPPQGRPDAEVRRAQLARRARTPADEMPTLVVAERGSVARAHLPRLSGSGAPPAGTVPLRTLEVSRELYETLAAGIEHTLSAFHSREPLARGMPREPARRAAGAGDPRLFAEVLESMPDRVVSEGPLLRLASHRVTLTLEQEAARDLVLTELAGARFSPPALSALIREHGDALVRALLDAGDLVKIADDIVLTAAQIEDAKTLIAEAAGREGPLTAARIKDLLGTTRKYAIPLLEHLDASGFTRRRGDVREPA